MRSGPYALTQVQILSKELDSGWRIGSTSFLYDVVHSTRSPPASVAQMAERFPRKEEVAGSMPVGGSKVQARSHKPKSVCRWKAGKGRTRPDARQTPGETLSREARGSCENRDKKEGAIVSCKCKARTYAGHLKKVEEGRASVHVYTGPYWGPTDDKKN